MKKIFGIVLILALLGAAYVGIKKKGDNPTLAKVGNVKISAEYFSKELANSPEAYLTYLSTLEGKKQLLDILLKEKVLMNAAAKSGIYRKKEVQENLKSFQARAKEQEEQFRKGLILKEYLRTLQDGKLKIEDSELKAYYEQNKPDYQNPTKITASHILCTSNEEAEAALKRLNQGKEEFSKVAKEVSKDPSAPRGGFIGEVVRGDLADLPEFETELFNLKTGGISKVVKTKIGYHIIKKSGEIKLPGQSYEEAAPQIRRILEKKKFDEWIDKEKEKQGVKINEKILASITIPMNRATQTPQNLEPYAK